METTVCELNNWQYKIKKWHKNLIFKVFLLFIPSIHILENLFFIYFISFGCTGSSLLFVGFPWLWWAGAILCYSAWASHRSGFSCCGEQNLGCMGFTSWHMGSVVVAYGLGCCDACGILRDQGLNPHTLHWQEDCVLRVEGISKMIEKWRSAISPYFLSINVVA